MPLPPADGNDNEWNRSAREAAEQAKKRPVRIESNREVGAYECRITDTLLPEPVWPDVTLLHLIRLAFRERVIASMDHIVLQQLRGER